MFSQKLNFKEGRFEMFGLRGVILPSFTLSKLLEEIYEREGDELFEILFKTGKAHGKKGIEEIGEKNKVSKREFISKLSDSANLMGLGKIELKDVNMDDQICVIRVENSPLVEEFKNSDAFSETERPVMELTRGIYHKMNSELWDTEVKSEFTKSEFLGDKCTEIRVEGND